MTHFKKSLLITSMLVMTMVAGQAEAKKDNTIYVGRISRFFNRFTESGLIKNEAYNRHVSNEGRKQYNRIQSDRLTNSMHTLNAAMKDAQEDGYFRPEHAQLFDALFNPEALHNNAEKGAPPMNPGAIHPFIDAFMRMLNPNSNPLLQPQVPNHQALTPAGSSALQHLVQQVGTPQLHQPGPTGGLPAVQAAGQVPANSSLDHLNALHIKQQAVMTSINNARGSMTPQMQTTYDNIKNIPLNHLDDLVNQTKKLNTDQKQLVREFSQIDDADRDTVLARYRVENLNGLKFTRIAGGFNPRLDEHYIQRADGSHIATMTKYDHAIYQASPEVRNFATLKQDQAGSIIDFAEYSQQQQEAIRELEKLQQQHNDLIMQISNIKP